jgi:prepilin-type N-terminal cleavage/methylation domain-containing protein
MKKIAKIISRKVLAKKPSFSKFLQHKPSLNFTKNSSLQAFSLIELSVVIIIISFLAVSALSLFSGSFVNTKSQITNTRIQSVYQALQNYVSTNGVLPCPAPLTDIKSTSATYGQSNSSCSTLTSSGNGVYVSSNLIYGMVPVRAINLNNDMAEDAFGNKLVYVIDKTFTSKTATTSPFSGSTSGTLNVKKYISSSITEEANAVFAIISHGANQKGAFPANSSAQILASSDSAESDNNSASPDLSVTYSSNGSAFDDIVLFKNKANLLLDSKSTSLQS